MKGFTSWILNKNFIILLFAALAIFASIQSYVLAPVRFENSIKEYTRYNNYVIFKQSFYHLIERKDLYMLYPEEHWDLFKYSPTFSLLFGGIAILPDSVGIIFWNTLNALFLVCSIYYLPKITDRQKGIILLLCLMEMMTSIQNEQSNGLMAGLIIFAFGFCERSKFLLAVLCLTLSCYIKLFGIVGFAMFIFYPEKIRIVIYSVISSLVLFMLPVFAVGIVHLKFLYQSWWRLLQADHSPSAYGFSVFGWLKTWFQFNQANSLILLPGSVLLLLPLLKVKCYRLFDFRLLMLCSLLVWLVIFNHMAESPTFIIAMAGVSIWFVTGRKTTMNISLFVFCLLFTSFSSTDLFPHDVRVHIIRPFVLKAFPCIIIWVKIVFDLWVMHWDQPVQSENTQHIPSGNAV